MSSRSNKVYILYDNRKLAFEQKRDEKISDLKRRLEKHLGVAVADIVLKLNGATLSDQSLLADINTSGKTLITMECVNNKIQVILSYDSVSSFITSYSSITLECVIDNFVIRNYSKIPSVIDLSFLATCKGAYLDNKKTLEELHIIKGDAIELQAVSDSIRSRKQFVKPEDIAVVEQSTVNSPGSFDTIKTMTKSDAISAATRETSSVKPTSTLKKISPVLSPPQCTANSLNSTQTLSQLLVILKGMREEIIQLRLQGGNSDAITDVNIVMKEIDESLLTMQQSLDASSDAWQNVLSLSKEIKNAIVGQDKKEVRCDIGEADSNLISTKLDRLINIVSSLPNGLNGGKVSNNCEELCLLREEVAVQSKQMSVLTSENKDLRRQVNMVLQNQSKMLRYLKQLTGRSCTDDMESDYISDATLVIPTNVAPTHLLSKAPHMRSLAKTATLFQAHRAILTEWLSNVPQGDWLCCYCGSEHGWTASDFHSHVDDAGSVLVIIRSTVGSIFGAYTQIGFQSTAVNYSFIHDDYSFMFVLESPFMDNCPAKFSALRDVAGIVYNSEYGAIFGSETEECLVISTDCNAENSHTYYFPCAYETPVLNNLSINGDPYFLVDEIEVYYRQ